MLGKFILDFSVASENDQFDDWTLRTYTCMCKGGSQRPPDEREAGAALSLHVVALASGTMDFRGSVRLCLP